LVVRTNTAEIYIHLGILATLTLWIWIISKYHYSTLTLSILFKKNDLSHIFLSTDSQDASNVPNVYFIILAYVPSIDENFLLNLLEISMSNLFYLLVDLEELLWMEDLLIVAYDVLTALIAVSGGRDEEEVHPFGFQEFLDLPTSLSALDIAFASVLTPLLILKTLFIELVFF
ncbi:hypothetical protein ACJX0J_014733, partial [Zea mays]